MNEFFFASVKRGATVGVLKMGRNISTALLNRLSSANHTVNYTDPDDSKAAIYWDMTIPLLA